MNQKEKQTVSEQMQDELEPIIHRRDSTEYDESDDIEMVKNIMDDIEKLQSILRDIEKKLTDNGL